ncbi:NACHT domain-containing protein [Streptomyces sp. NPDC058000]|uniref:NACHT domain-containing protein n=1 Tax=Streptomyces sp. NPDC058000 TaxID=3346299 RepID=UPI0036E36F7B
MDIPRMVLLGAPGAGKTTLAMRLILALLADPRPRVVPVMLTLASWNPHEEALRDWLIRRIGEDYRMALSGRATAEELVTAGRVLPVLDGLDEIAPAHRAAALPEIDRAFDGADPIVLTCRAREFREVVADGSGVTQALVVEAEPVPLPAVTDFLGAFEGGPPADRWRAVLTELSRRPGMTAVLSNPLMVTLLRSQYGRGGTDADTLLNEDDFPDAATLERHLLDGVIPAAFDGAGTPAGDVDGPGRPVRAWPAEAAERWLTELAHRADGDDLAWWQLPGSVLKPSLAYLWLAMTVFWCASALVLFRALAPDALGLWTVAGLGLAALAVGTLGVLPLTHESGMEKVWETQEEPPGKLRRALRHLGVFAGCVLGSTVLVAVAVGLTALAIFFINITNKTASQCYQVIDGTCYQLVDQDPFSTGGSHDYQLMPVNAAELPRYEPLSFAPIGEHLALLLLVVLGIGVLVFVHALLSAPPPQVDMASSPGSVLKSARRRGVQSAVFALTSGLLANAAVWTLIEASPPTRALTALLGLTVLLFVLARSVWVQYALSVGLLAVRCRLPWRLMPFCADAHTLGVLRQAGSLHQFRHGRLKEHLASRHPRHREAVDGDTDGNGAEEAADATDGAAPEGASVENTGGGPQTGT